MSANHKRALKFLLREEEEEFLLEISHFSGSAEQTLIPIHKAKYLITCPSILLMTKVSVILGYSLGLYLNADK